MSAEYLIKRDVRTMIIQYTETKEPEMLFSGKCACPPSQMKSIRSSGPRPAGMLMQFVYPALRL